MLNKREAIRRGLSSLEGARLCGVAALNKTHTYFIHYSVSHRIFPQIISMDLFIRN